MQSSPRKEISLFHALDFCGVNSGGCTNLARMQFKEGIAIGESGWPGGSGASFVVMMAMGRLSDEHTRMGWDRIRDQMTMAKLMVERQEKLSIERAKSDLRELDAIALSDLRFDLNWGISTSQPRDLFRAADGANFEFLDGYTILPASCKSSLD